jgi:hypothetical protein
VPRAGNVGRLPRVAIRTRRERRLSVASGTLSRMGRVALYNKSAVDDLVARQHGLITRSQALLCGLTKQPLRTRTRPGGSWSVLLPGIYSTFTGTPTADQRVMAALLYAGPGSLITGQTAMAAHGINTLDARSSMYSFRSNAGGRTTASCT